MLVHVSWWVVLQIFCLVQGLTTSLYLLVKRVRVGATPWLGLLLLGLTLQVLDYCLSSSGVYFRHKGLYFTPLFFSWCYGPLLWGAVRAYYGERGPAKWHFVPGVVQLTFYVVVAAQDFDTKLWVWVQVHKPYTRYVEFYGAGLSVATYLWLAARLVRVHHDEPRWLGWGIRGLAAFYALAALDHLVNSWYLPVGAPKFYLTSLLLPVLVYAVALLSWLRGTKAGSQPPASVPEGTVVTPVAVAVELTAKPVPDPVQLDCLMQVMEAEGLYRDPDLSLSILAQRVGLLPNTVSYLLNAGLGQTFTEWVNGYRVAEVVRRLGTPDAQRYTVLALALDAGFNSKTTSNRVFKERNGLTPSQYLKRCHPTLRDDAALPSA